MDELDFWNPNNWPALFGGHEHRIYGCERLSIWSIVDEEDYAHCVQWLWLPKKSRGGNKVYLKRNLQSGYGREGRTRHSRYLHTEVMLRTGIEPPSPLHTIVDHRNGNGMDCRRANLRWATPTMNARNRFGSHSHEIIE